MSLEAEIKNLNASIQQLIALHGTPVAQALPPANIQATSPTAPLGITRKQVADRIVKLAGMPGSPEEAKVVAALQPWGGTFRSVKDDQYAAVMAALDKVEA